MFPVSQLGAQDVGLVRGLRLLGDSPDIHEEVHAIWSRRGSTIPWCARWWLLRTGAARRSRQDAGASSLGCGLFQVPALQRRLHHPRLG